MLIKSCLLQCPSGLDATLHQSENQKGEGNVMAVWPALVVNVIALSGRQTLVAGNYTQLIGRVIRVIIFSCNLCGLFFLTEFVIC